MPVGMPAVQHFLHALPKILCNERSVDPSIGSAVPIEFSCVESISEDLIYRGSGHCIFTLPKEHAFSSRHVCQMAEGILSRSIPFEHESDDWSQGWIRLDYSLAVRSGDVSIT